MIMNVGTGYDIRGLFVYDFCFVFGLTVAKK